MPDDIFVPAYGMPLGKIFEISITFGAKCLRLMGLAKMSGTVELVFRPAVAFAASGCGGSMWPDGQFSVQSPK